MAPFFCFALQGHILTGGSLEWVLIAAAHSQRQGANGDIVSEGSRRQSTGLTDRNMIARHLPVGETAEEVKAQ